MADYITTYTGGHFYPAEPNMECFHIADVAHALSLICRGNGHVKTFFSVGQHCIFCAEEARARGLSTRVQLACLLHDASEAYMSDVPKPFKKHLQSYCELEEKLLILIYEKYLGSALNSEESELVRLIDHDLLAHDLFYLLGEGEKEKLPALSAEISYESRSFESVEREYLKLFESLCNF